MGERGAVPLGERDGEDVSKGERWEGVPAGRVRDGKLDAYR